MTTAADPALTSFTWFDGKRYMWPLALIVPTLPFLGMHSPRRRASRPGT